MEWKTEEDIMEEQTILALFNECMAMSDQIAEQIDRLISKIDKILKEDEQFNEVSNF